MPIKLIIFDAGDVLYNFSWLEVFNREIKKFVKKHGLKHSVEDFHKSWYDENIGKPAATGKISLREAHRRHLKKMGIPEDLLDEYEEIDFKALKNLKIKDSKIKETILKLKKKGYKIAVLSDTPHPKDHKKIMLDIVGLDGIFDEIFVSSELGHTKPDKEAYLIVLNHFHAKPSETVFVAHDEDELIGAKKLGIKTISYQGHKSGDFVIQNFKEILEVVENL